MPITKTILASYYHCITSVYKSWITENPYSIYAQYIRKWLEMPTSGALKNVYLASNKFLNIIPALTKFIQRQTTILTALKSSPNDFITRLWKLTN